MGELIQTVKNGVIEQTSKSTAAGNTAKSNELGKDAFLQLLITQMKYQDPLNPSSNTEYVAQLATFSQLEQIQNLRTITSNAQALNLVGRYVIVKTKSETGAVNEIGGRVDFVNISNGKAQISINGTLYSMDDLDTVIDDNYILEKGRPSITEKAELVYDAEDPKDLSFKVNMGEGETTASDVAVLIDQTLLDSSVVTLKDNTVTISKSVFEKAANGTYKATVIFNDPLYTTVSGMVTITVKNSKAEQNGSEEPEEPGESDQADEATGIEEAADNS